MTHWWNDKSKHDEKFGSIKFIIFGIFLIVMTGLMVIGSLNINFLIIIIYLWIWWAYISVCLDIYKAYKYRKSVKKTLQKSSK